MKLSIRNLNILLTHCTNKEITLLIHLAQFQDTDGIVGGIYYKDAIKAAGMSTSGFYKCLDKLEYKGLIRQFTDERTDYGYKAFQIIDNKFKNEADRKRGYFNLNYKILHSKEFLKMSRVEKVIIINILKIMNIHAGKASSSTLLASDNKLTKYKIDKERPKRAKEILKEIRRGKHQKAIEAMKSGEPNIERLQQKKQLPDRCIPLRFDTLMDWTGVELPSLKKAIEKLSKVISIVVEGKKIKIVLDHNFHLPDRRETDEEGNPTTEAEIKNKHIISHVLHRMKERASKQEINDIIHIIKKYGLDSFHIISQLISGTIRICGYLDPRYFHSVVKASVS